MVQWLLVISLSVFASAQEDEVGEAQAFRSQVDELNERYENFFGRQTEQKLYTENIKQGLGELKAQRRSEEKEKIEALKEFKSQPRPKSDTTALEAEHEALKKAQDQVHERHRKSHVDRRDQLRRISESARRIPENQDAGLE